MCSGCTCFGLGGAGVSVNIAKSPLGPWTTGTISLDPGCANWTTCGATSHNGPHGCAPITQAQQNAVITIPSTTGTETSSTPARFIWTGDRWQSGASGRIECNNYATWHWCKRSIGQSISYSLPPNNICACVDVLMPSGGNGTGAPAPGLKGWDYQ